MADFKHSLDPDFIVTLAGKDITEFVQNWELLDDEEGMSTLSVQLANPDMRNSGMASEWDWLAIRFGYQADLSGQAGFYIMEVTEAYPSGEPTLQLKAYDETASQAGDKQKGNFDTNNTKTALEQNTDNAGMLPDIEGAGIEFEEKETKCNAMNENGWECNRKYMHTLKSSGGSGSGGTSPNYEQKSSKQNTKPNKIGYSRSGAGLTNPTNGGEGKNILDQNRMQNDKNTNQGEPITGSLELVGYPWLRAKTCVNILNVGPKSSGTYYVKSVTHRWDASSGYMTSASLIRSGYGKGGAGQAQPIVYYADIYKKNQLYVGPRKIDSEPEDHFTYGVGGPLVSFTMSTKLQSNRGGGGGGKTATHDLRDSGKASEEDIEDAGDLPQDV